MIGTEAAQRMWDRGSRARVWAFRGFHPVVRLVQTACLLGALFGMAGPMAVSLAGYRAMAVLSGSMEPGIHAGDALVIDPEGPVRVGDVITFRPFGVERLTTHRVVAVKRIDGDTYYQTKGDDNDTPDPNLAAAESVVGTVSVRLPGVGRLMVVGTTKEGRLLLLGIPALGLMVRQGRELLRQAARRAVVRPSAPPLVRHRAPRFAAATVVFLAVFIAPFGTGGPDRTAATYADTASVPGNAFSTATTFP